MRGSRPVAGVRYAFWEFPARRLTHAVRPKGPSRSGGGELNFEQLIRSLLHPQTSIGLHGP